MQKKPNIVLIMTDQQRADWLGCAGHPVLKTPHIDALAAEGTRFTNFNVATPVCQPNRASIMTGRYPSVHGLRHNGLNLPRNQATFAEVLRAGGYSTAMIGKSHLQTFTDTPQRRGSAPDTGPIAEANKDAGPYRDERPMGSPHEVPRPYYGFDHVELVGGHGAAPRGGHYIAWLKERRPDDWETLRDPANRLAHNYSCPQAYRTPLPEALYPTSFVTERAEAFLSEQSPDQPFFAFVSFPDPHHPFNPPGRYWDMYDPAEFSVDLPYTAHRNPNPILRAAHTQYADGSAETGRQKLFMASERQLQEAMALTAGMITMVDDAVGRVVTALKSGGLWDNTIVIFNSDHGDYLGAFSLLLKGPFQHHSINRVPFIWRAPGAEAGLRDDLCSSLDIAPTLIEAAGLKPYNGIQGRSLWNGERREALLIEHEDNARIKLHFTERPANLRTLLTDDYRLSLYAGENWGDLVHLATDPDETHNLWDDPAHAATRAALTRRMVDEMMRATDTSPFPTLLA